jgi:DNA-binding protein Fis
MGYRDRTASEKSGNYDFCIMEVRLRKKNAPADVKDDLRLLSVDSHYETLRFVQDNMEECISNIVKLKRLNSTPIEAMHAPIEGINESAELFQKNLEPLMSSMAATQGQGVMDKLSTSLKKALLMLVMERYQSDREKACKVLGISREKLENELKLCGVAR